MRKLRGKYRRARVRAGLMLVIVGMALGSVLTACGQAASSQAGPLHPAVAILSHVWSGYVQTGGPYTSVSATWVVPSISSTQTVTSTDSEWVGIDGYQTLGGAPLIEAGTVEGWNGTTQQAGYVAYWRLLQPDGGHKQVAFAVAPGDSIYAEVSQVTGPNGFDRDHQWLIYLLDRNSGASFQQVMTYVGPLSSVEFGDAAFQPNLGPLDPFDPVTFRNARINGNGASFGESQRLNLLEGSNLVATPSLPNDAGNGFTIHYGPLVTDPPATPLVQRHTDGSVWEWTGVPCSGAGDCLGWTELDDNPATVAVSAGAGTVYQRHRDGSIWEWMGAGCSGPNCLSWVELDDNPAAYAITAGNGTVYQMRTDGSVWQSTGAACTGASCPGWVELDDNPATRTITAGAGSVFELRTDGTVWRSTGAACHTVACPGWTELDDSHVPATINILAGANTPYELRADGSIWESTGTACSGTDCPGWTQLDASDPGITQLAAAGTSLYKVSDDVASSWTGQPCTTPAACPDWTQIGAAGWTLALTASPDHVFRLLHDGTMAVGGSQWQEIDDNITSAAISAPNGT